MGGLEAAVFILIRNPTNEEAVGVFREETVTYVTLVCVSHVHVCMCTCMSEFVCSVICMMCVHVCLCEWVCMCMHACSFAHITFMYTCALKLH